MRTKPELRWVRVHIAAKQDSQNSTSDNPTLTIFFEVKTRGSCDFFLRKNNLQMI